jgi:hypothetical protein
MKGEAIPDFGGCFRSKDIRQRLVAMDVWAVQYPADRLCLSRYAIARVTQLEQIRSPRSRVVKVKWRPGFGSAAKKTLALARDASSLSRRAFRPGTAGEAGRRSACSVIGF